MYPAAKGGSCSRSEEIGRILFFTESLLSLESCVVFWH